MSIAPLVGAIALVLVLLCGGAYADAASDLQQARWADLRGDPQSAVELYTRAIESGELSDDQMYEARLGRGIAYAQNKQADEAIADLSEVIRIAPDERAHFARGNIYFSTGQYAEAGADYDVLYRMSPEGFQSQNPLYRNFRPILSLGATKFCLGDYEAAAKDFASAVPTDRSRHVDQQYATIWFYLARGRHGQDERELLARQMPTTAAKPDWPQPVILYILDKMPASQLLADAAGEANGAVRRRKYCETYFYVGENTLLHGDTKKAVELLKTAIAACDDFTDEYQAAKAELQRLR